MNNENDLISVIIPVYNVEKELRRCLDSIIGQTYRNLEIILVDDGSTDKSGSICDEYENKDSRTKVIHKRNGGLSDARNCGIEIATGNYITFVDSDDYVTADYVEYLLMEAKKNGADVSIVSHKKIWNENDQLNDVKEIQKIFTPIEAVEDLFYQRHIETSAWGKLYRRNIFQNIRFPVGLLYEDLATTYLLLLNSKKIVWSNAKKYYYFQREDSIMYREFSEKKMDRIHISEEILDKVHLQYPELEKAAISRTFISCIQVFRELAMQNKEYIELQKEILAGIKKYRAIVLTDSRSKNMTRIIALASFAPSQVLIIFGKLYKRVYK